MSSIILIIVLGVVAWFWQDSLRAKKIAVEVSRRACESRNLQLLDDTAALRSLGLRRDQQRRWRLFRIYQFEYFNAQHLRLSSTITICGQLVVNLGLNVASNIVPFPKLHGSC